MPPLSLNLLITARIPLVTLQLPLPSTKEAVCLHRYNVKIYSPHHKKKLTLDRS